MLDEYLSLGGVELGNNARAVGYGACLSCCAGFFKGDVCDGVHDATGEWTDAIRTWQTTARNGAPNPRAVSGGTAWLNGGTAGTPTYVTDMPGDVPTAARSTLSGTGTGILGERTVDAYALGTVLNVVFRIRASAAMSGLVLDYRPSGQASTSGEQTVALTPSTIAAGEVRDIAASITLATAATTTSWFGLKWSTGVTAATIDMTRLLISALTDRYFDATRIPDGADPLYNRVSQVGAANASASLWETNNVTTPATSLNPPYDCSAIQSAPWYDQDRPESADLAGFYLLSVKGVTDGTMTAPVVENVDSGGTIGAGRYATKNLRVKSMIVGCGMLAAEYGLAWLKAALGENFCARHGDSCGTSDLEFFMDCPPALDPADGNYGLITASYRRWLHGVACTSAPLKVEEYETMSGAYVIVVEYILTAESPFVWGEMIPFQNTGAVLTAYDDIPFNLMRYPSGEVGDGVPAVTATQYAFNGSVEYGATGWANAVTNIAAGITAGASTDLAAVGPNSYRVRLLATGAVAAGVIDSYYDVALGAVPAGSKPSVSVWAAGLVFAGAPTIASLAAAVEWRTASATISETALGTIPSNGGNASATGLTIPATATIARLHVRATGVTAAAADDLRIYADAFGLTVP